MSNIVFPEWVEKPGRQSKAALATKRLRFLVFNAALQTDGNITLPQFSKRIGYDRSIVHRALAAGRFHRKMADAAQAAYGEDLLPAAWLINPLEIDQK